MKSSTRRIFAVPIAAAISLMALTGVISKAHATGIPVFDAGNLSQNVITAMENVAHTAKQIQQYQTQLKQYENMLQNTTRPPQHIWDAATVTMNQLRASIDTLSYYKSNLGSIDAYLARSRDSNAYRNHPCFSVNGCTPAQWEAMKADERLGSEAQKRANDAAFRGLDQQQASLEGNAAQLQRLQAMATGAGGQLQAIGYANQFASHQSNQLLQIRGLLIAQQNAIATRNQALADREAKESAASANLRSGVIRRSSAASW